MTIEPNPAAAGLVRAPEEMRGRDKYVCLDRNECLVPLSSRQFDEMLARLGPQHFTSYPDPSPLLDRLAGELSVPAAWICLTNGSDAAIRKVFQTYVRPGDAVLLADPTYAMYSIYAQMFGGRVELVSYRPDRSLDVARFRAKLDDRPRIAALACPDQPTGAVLPLDALREIVGAAHARGILCVVDEAYFPFYPVTAVPLTAEFDNLVVTRSFSKAGALAGLRLGYLVAQPPIVNAVDKVRGAHEVNAVAIQAAAYLLDHPEIGAGRVAALEEGRAVLIAAATALGLRVPPCPANFQLIEFPDPVRVPAVVATLERSGFLVKGGFTHPSVAACIRVTLAGPPVMSSFARALREAVTA